MPRPSEVLLGWVRGVPAGEQKQFAQDAGLQPSTISMWLRTENPRKANPDIDKLPAIADAFGISLTALLLGEPPEDTAADSAVAESRPQYDPSGPGTASADPTVSTSEHPPESETEDMGQLLETLQQIAARQEEMARDLKTVADALVARSGRHTPRVDATRGRPTVSRRPQRTAAKTHRRGVR